MRNALVLLALASGVAGCGNCPFPVFANPTTARGPAAAASGASIVVRWSPSSDDVLPPSYYQHVVDFNQDLGQVPEKEAKAIVLAVQPTGVRELTLGVDPARLDAFLRTHKDLNLWLRFNDTRGAVKCSHPGMFDTYIVELTLSFDASGQVARASFSNVSILPGPL
jgi:hypothetical protein